MSIVKMSYPNWLVGGNQPNFPNGTCQVLIPALYCHPHLSRTLPRLVCRAKPLCVIAKHTRYCFLSIRHPTCPLHRRSPLTLLPSQLAPPSTFTLMISYRRGSPSSMQSKFKEALCGAGKHRCCWHVAFRHVGNQGREGNLGGDGSRVGHPSSLPHSQGSRHPLCMHCK